MTVSFVLNNKPGQVSAETRERVLRAVREVGYRPRASSRPDVDTTVHTIGIAVGQPYNSLTQAGYFSAILNAVLIATHERRLNVLLYHSSLFHNDTQESVRAYLDGHCDGLIVLAASRGNAFVPILAERGIPAVLIGSQDADGHIASVDLDNTGEAERAVDHLVALGHRRIGFVGGPDFVESANRRGAGYRKARERHGLAPDARFDSGPVLSEAEVYQWVTKMLRVCGKERPTALLCWNDQAAVRAMLAVQDSRLRVPEQFSLIGFDDSPFAATATPPLTTVRQPYEEIGAKAVALLMERIQSPHAAPCDQFLAGKLIVRDSVAPCTVL